MPSSLSSSPLNLNTLLLILGLALIIGNIVWAIIRVRRGTVRTGIVSVGLALIGCALITVGVIGVTLNNASMPSLSALSAMGALPGANSTSNTASNSPSNTTGGGTANVNPPAANPVLGGAIPGGGQAPPEAMTQMAQGTLPAQLQTMIASGQVPAQMQTMIASNMKTGGAAPSTGGSGTGSGTGTGTGTNAGASTGGFPSGMPNPLTFIIQGLSTVIAAVIAVLIIIASVLLYRYERKRANFSPSQSAGILNGGAGTYVLIAALLIPAIPSQLSGSTVSAAGLPTRTGPAPTRVVQQTAAPTITLTATGTPTAVPSLTPTVSATPMVLYTVIAMVSTDPANVAAATCLLTAQTTLNLRGDPSTTQAGIGRILAGSQLNAIGRTEDSKWWRVIDIATSVEGWVNGDFVKPVADCAKVPVAGLIVTPSATPSPTKPLSGGATQAAVTGVVATAVSTAAKADSAVTAAPCTLITTTTAAFRSDTSRTKAALAQIPEQTVLAALGKSADGQWWQISYASQTGWVNASTVLASSSCKQVGVVKH